jgi:alanyl-tRNA synthetase
MTQKHYLIEKRMRGTVSIVELIPGDKPAIRLAGTWFHPQGGGQKADIGKIGPSQVVHVAHNGQYVDHFVDSLDTLEVGKSYPFEIDSEWRCLNSVYHTSGHLIASIVEKMSSNLTAISGHQWPGEARIEFQINSDQPTVITAEDLNTELDTCLRHGLDIKVCGDPYTDRAITIGSFKGIPCGGTHVENLQNIGKIRATKMKKKGKKLRVSYEAIPATQQ